MRINTSETLALVVDIQEKLFPHISNSEILLKNSIKLIKGLKLLEIPFILNEQYPKGIGHTITPIKELLSNEEVFEKVTFSCAKTITTLNAIKNKNKKFIIIFGIETHVCVLQSILDLLEDGFVPILVSDCTNSRKEFDRDIAIERARQSGAIITTYESLLFELCVSSKNEVFKEISKIIK
jgi:hypothetical protein